MPIPPSLTAEHIKQAMARIDRDGASAPSSAKPSKRKPGRMKSNPDATEERF